MLVGTTLTGANLSGASFAHADLSLACINGAKLSGADFSDTLWSGTALARCTGLEAARGLDSVRIIAPSTADLPTLREAVELLSDAVLTQLGLEPDEIAVLRAKRSAAAQAV